MMTMQQIKDAMAREFPQATQEVHNFLSWMENKTNQLSAAENLLKQHGYTVTPPAQ